ncbi:response regulator [Thalassotalea piscium]
MTKHSNDSRQNSAHLCFLVVEDNRVNQAIAVGVLKNIASVVDIAGNGVEALTLLSTQHDSRYDVIFMDCQMPELDGYDTTLAIRAGKAGKHYCDIPIIAMTSNDSNEDAEKCLHVGMNGYMTKPINISVINELLAVHLPQNRQSIDMLDALSNVQSEPLNEESLKQTTLWNKAALYQRVSHNEKLAASLIDMFLEDAPLLHGELLKAIAQKNLKDIAFYAHKFLGICGNIGGEVMYDNLKVIEKLAKQGDLDTIEQVTVDLKNNFNQLLMKLSEFCL